MIEKISGLDTLFFADVYLYDKKKEMLKLTEIKKDKILQVVYDLKAKKIKRTVTKELVPELPNDESIRLFIGTGNIHSGGISLPILFLARQSREIEIIAYPDEIHIEYHKKPLTLENTCKKDMICAYVFFPIDIKTTHSIYGLFITRVTSKKEDRNKGFLRSIILKLYYKPTDTPIEVLSDETFTLERPLIIDEYLYKYEQPSNRIYPMTGRILVEKDGNKYRVLLVSHDKAPTQFRVVNGFILTNVEGYPIGTDLRNRSMNLSASLLLFVLKDHFILRELNFVRSDNYQMIIRFLMNFIRKPPTIFMVSNEDRTILLHDTYQTQVTAAYLSSSSIRCTPTIIKKDKGNKFFLTASLFEILKSEILGKKKVDSVMIDYISNKVLTFKKLGSAFYLPFFSKEFLSVS